MPDPNEAELVGRYNSTRNPTNVYEVRRHADGVLSCSCPGWRFNKPAQGQPKTCRHVRRVAEGLDDDVAIQERLHRVGLLQQAFQSANLGLAVYPAGTSGAASYPNGYHRPNTPTAVPFLERLLVAIEATGLTAPRAEADRSVPARSRGFRVITLDD